MKVQLPEKDCVEVEAYSYAQAVMIACARYGERYRADAQVSMEVCGEELPL